MLNDALHQGLGSYATNSQSGIWRVILGRSYRLLLSERLDQVLSYNTREGDRTWVQYKAGVPGCHPGELRSGPEWFRQLQGQSKNVECTLFLLRLYARIQGHAKVRQANAADVLAEVRHRVLDALDEWDGSEGRSEIIDRRDPSLRWVVIGRPNQVPLVISLYRAT